MANGVSTLGQALDQMERLKVVQDRFSILSSQLATGKKTQKFSGLGQDVLATKRARANFQSVEVYTNNIKKANTRMELMLNSLREFRAQSENLLNAMVGFNQQGTHQEGDIVYRDDPASTLDDDGTTSIGQFSGDMDTDFQLMQNLAGDVYDFLIDLANQQDSDRYLFSGADGSVKPIDDSAGTLDAVIGVMVGNWKDELSASNITTDQFIANLRERDSTTNANAITDSIVGYSASLSDGNAGKVSVIVDDTKQVEYTSLANSQGIRDILVAASLMKNEDLGPMVDVYDEPYTFGDPAVQDGAPGDTMADQQENFYSLFNSMTQMVHAALEDIDTEIHQLELAQVRIAQARESHESQKSLYLNIISEAEDADINAVAVEINTLQITLDASYRVTARIQELSLVNFI